MCECVFSFETGEKNDMPFHKSKTKYVTFANLLPTAAGIGAKTKSKNLIVKQKSIDSVFKYPFEFYIT